MTKKQTTEKKVKDAEPQGRPWLLVGTAVVALSLLVFFSVRATQQPSGDAMGDMVALAPQPQPGPEPKEAASNKEDAQMAPDFSLPELGGKPFTLSQHKGQVVLIDFWATWCGPCRMAIPHLIELQDDYKKKGFTIVGVSLDQQGEAVVKPFYKAWKMNYPVVVDSMGEVAQKYGGIRSIPMALLVGRDGKVITGFLGYRPKEEIETAIKAALAKG